MQSCYSCLTILSGLLDAKEIIATTNAKYYDEVASAKLKEIVRRTPGNAVPPSMYPRYKPVYRSSNTKLSTRIRPAEPIDVVQITDIQGDAYFSNYRHIIPPQVLDTYIDEDLLPRKYEYWQRQIEQPGNRVFVAMLGSKVLGFSALHVLPDQPDAALLDAHYVSPQVEDYGVEYGLLAQVERTTKQPLVIRAQATLQESPQTAYLRSGGFEPSDFPVAAPTIGGYPLALQPLERRPYKNLPR